MTYLVTARKWRPMVFEDVVGQSHVTATLQNAIRSNRIAHAYLFSGPRGIGKTTMARLLAKAVNCRNPNGLNPCNRCDICAEITESRCIDVFEIDGASNRGIEEIRNLRETVRYGATKCRYKVYIIDEVHMLTKEAFNALLKTLEEPPSSILFVFATTEVQKVPLTILSRCHRFDFRRIAIDEITARLKYIAEQEGVAIDDDSLLLIAKKGDGSLRDAQSIFDQAVSFCGKNIVGKQLIEALSLVDQDFFFTVTDLIKTRDTKGGLGLVDNLMRRGYDMKEFLSGLGEHFRNLLVVRSTNETTLVEASEAHRKRYREEAQHFSESDLLRLMKLVAETESAVRWSTQPRVRLEAGLLQMIKFDSTVEIQRLLQEIEALKQKIDGASSVGGTPRSRQDNPSRGEFASPSPPVIEAPRSLSGTTNPIMRETSAHYSPVPEREKAKNSEAAPGTGQKSVQQLSFDEIQGRWNDFVEEIRKQRIHVGTLLSQSRPLAAENGVIKLGCVDEFHLTSLKRSKEFLLESAQKVYGKKLRIEISLVPFTHNGDNRANPPGPNQQSKSPSLDHPIIKALMRELGAEPLQ